MHLAVPRRQPLTGTAISAICGILLAEFFKLPLGLLGGAIAFAAVVSLARPMTWLTHLLIATAFFALHQTQMHDTPGRQLSARLGERARAVSVTGTVASEAKISPNDFTTFLLQLDSIEVDGRREACAATVRARWKGNPNLGDEVRLTGIAEPIPAPRNPGVFDLRAYLARR